MTRLLTTEREERTSEGFGFEWERVRFKTFKECESHLLKRFSLTAGEIRGKRILDAGCGYGRLSYVAHVLGARSVTAFDISQRAVNQARKEHGNIKSLSFSTGNVLDPDLYPESTFDLIFSFGVLHHTEDTRRAFLNLARWLKPGGILAVWVYEKQNMAKEGVNRMLKSIAARLPYGVLWKLCYIPAVIARIPVLRHANILVPMSPRQDFNFDWYQCAIQHHHTEGEVLAWAKEAGLQCEIVSKPVPKLSSVLHGKYGGSISVKCTKP